MPSAFEAKQRAGGDVIRHCRPGQAHGICRSLGMRRGGFALFAVCICTNSGRASGISVRDERPGREVSQWAVQFTLFNVCLCVLICVQRVQVKHLVWSMREKERL